MIGETGTVENGGSKPAWIRDALTTQLPANFPWVKALIWFNASDGKFNLRVQTSPQSLAAFRSAIALDTYQANKYAQLDQSPIPSPEQIVLRPPSPTATVPVSETVFGGPAAGAVRCGSARCAQNAAATARAKGVSMRRCHHASATGSGYWILSQALRQKVPRQLYSSASHRENRGGSWRIPDTPHGLKPDGFSGSPSYGMLIPSLRLSA